MTTMMQTFARNLKSPGLYPFAIGFTSVLLLGVSQGKVSDKEYVEDAANKRFAKPFVKSAAERLRAEGVAVAEPSSH